MKTNDLKVGVEYRFRRDGGRNRAVLLSVVPEKPRSGFVRVRLLEGIQPGRERDVHISTLHPLHEKSREPATPIETRHEVDRCPRRGDVVHWSKWGKIEWTVVKIQGNRARIHCPSAFGLPITDLAPLSQITVLHVEPPAIHDLDEAVARVDPTAPRMARTALRADESGSGPHRIRGWSGVLSLPKDELVDRLEFGPIALDQYEALVTGNMGLAEPDPTSEEDIERMDRSRLKRKLCAEIRKGELIRGGGGKARIRTPRFDVPLIETSDVGGEVPVLSIAVRVSPKLSRRRTNRRRSGKGVSGAEALEKRVQLTGRLR